MIIPPNGMSGGWWFRYTSTSSYKSTTYYKKRSSVYHVYQKIWSHNRSMCILYIYIYIYIYMYIYIYIYMHIYTIEFTPRNLFLFRRMSPSLYPPSSLNAQVKTKNSLDQLEIKLQSDVLASQKSSAQMRSFNSHNMRSFWILVQYIHIYIYVHIYIYMYRNSSLAELVVLVKHHHSMAA